MKGYIGAILELVLFFTTYEFIRSHTSLSAENTVSMFWLGFTVLTGLWELKYLTSRKSIGNYAEQLIENKQHVWTNNYNIYMLLPTEFSKLFYAEYGAWADREYMMYKDDWSFTVEGTHCLFCGAFSFVALICVLCDYHTTFLMTLSLAMGSQAMNSIMYLAQYVDQCKEQNSVNYNSDTFPCGKYMLKRVFMWVNMLWIIMPTYVCVAYLI